MTQNTAMDKPADKPSDPPFWRTKTLDAMKSMVEKLLGIAPPIRKSDSDSFQAVSRLKRFGPF